MSTTTNNKDDISAPTLCTFPKGVPRRLVDTGLLHYEASLAGFAERYRRGETPHTVHVWWARRPHTAMRSLVYACITHDKSASSFATLQSLSSAFMPPSLVLGPVQEAFLDSKPNSPRVLDMFGGGGTIGFEGALLGAEMHSIDSNELAVFIQKSLLELAVAVPQETLAGLLARSGKRVLEKLKSDTSALFPRRESVFGYIWTYSLACESCGYRYFLSKRPWLSRKKNRRLALAPYDGALKQEIGIRDFTENEGDLPRSAWKSKKATVTCPRCNCENMAVDIRKATDELVAVIGTRPTSGKEFSDVTAGSIPPGDAIKQFENSLLSSMKIDLPKSSLPKWSGIVNPALYGVETHSDFLNARQRAVLLCLIKNLLDEHKLLAKTEGNDTAKAVTGLLSGLLDQLIDWNCRLSMWISQNEQVGRAFSGPGVPMLWDYVETDPVARGPANLWSKLDRIIAGASCIARLPRPCTVKHAYAQDVPYADGYFDAIVTDPPYYDNIYYNALADFFFAWKRILFSQISPKLFKEKQTDSTRELVASAFRSGSKELAHKDFCLQFGKAILEAERVLKDDGVFSLMYSHSSFRGWEAIVLAYRATKLRITSVQPLSIERKARPRAMGSEAVNTCVVFVAHKSKLAKKNESLERMCERLDVFTSKLVEDLKQAGWRDDDIGVAAFSQGVAMLSNVSAVIHCSSDIEAMKAFEATIRKHVASFRVTDRRSL
jgi:putative DNA methylase